MTDSSDILVNACSHPLRVEQAACVMPEGIDCLDMLERIQPDPFLARHAVITINEKLIEKIDWESTCLARYDRVIVRTIPVPAGGGDGKDPLKTVLMLGVMVLAFTMAGPAGGYLANAAGFGTAAAWGAVASTAIMTVGTLAVNALIPPPTQDMPQISKSPEAYVLETAANTARPFQPIPIILGFHRFIPPLGAVTYTIVKSNTQSLDMCVTWGYGRLDISDIKVGETPIGDIPDLSYETSDGYPADTPLKLYPKQVSEDHFAIQLKEVDGFTEKTTENNTDKISFDISFYGLFQLNQYEGQSGRLSRQVLLYYQWRIVGGSWSSDIAIRVKANKTTLVRKTVSISPDTLGNVRGRYEVRVKRDSQDYDIDEMNDDSYWTALRSITNEDPIDTPFPLARTAIRVKASQFASGRLDNLSALCKTYCLDWTGSAWVEGVTQNCASLFRYVLQCNANGNPVADSGIDLDQLVVWHDFCVDKGLAYNGIIINRSSVKTVLDNICSAGRARRVLNDGKWSVIIDTEQTLVRQHFSPRNSWNISSTRVFKEPPHAWRIPFNNEDQDYNMDEMMVYDDGYDENTATIIEQLQLPGVTAPDQIYQLGRYHLAVARLRPEVHLFNADIEHIVCKRGNLIRLALPHALIGIAQGRIKELTTDGSGYVTDITLDEYCETDSGTYGLRIRHSDGATSIHEIASVDSTGYVLTLTASITSDLPEVGDLCFFGLEDLETIECLVKSITQESYFNARIEAIDYAPAIFTAAESTIPFWDSQITPLARPAVPIIESIKSDESVMVRHPGGGLETRVAINLRAIAYDYTVEVNQRVNGTDDYQAAEIITNTVDLVLLTGFEDGLIYDIQIRYLNENKLPGEYTTIIHEVKGQLNPPDGLSNFTLSSIGGMALLRWDKLSEIDVIYGGRVEFRHAQLSTNTWSESISIGESAKGADTFAVLPLKEGLYFARVFDAGGRPCEPDDIVSFFTKQATALTYANLTSLTESSTGFNGTHDDTQENGSGYLEIDQSADALSGNYIFQSGIDLGSVKRFRLTNLIKVSIINNTSTVDDRTTLIDTWEDFDNTSNATGTDAVVFVRTTDDDPAGSPTWTDYQRIDSGEFYARAMSFKIVLTCITLDYNINVEELIMNVEEVA